MRVFLLLLLLLLAGLAGCVSTSGRKLDHALVDKIDPGRTTQAELVGWFGPPHSQGMDGARTVLGWAYFEIHSGFYGVGMDQRQQLLSVALTNGLVERFVITGNLDHEEKDH